MGVNNLAEFRERAGGILPRIPRHSPPQGRTEFTGLNDLLQYLFAADRGNSRVSERYDPLSPPALRVLKTICDACAETGTPVSVCGELAGRPLEAFALIALGFDRLSTPPAGVGPVKRMILSVDREAARRGMAGFLKGASGSVRNEIESLARKLNVAL